MLEVGLLEYISDARVLSRPSVEKRAEDCTLLFRSIRSYFIDFGIRSISCKLLQLSGLAGVLFHYLSE